jgi:serine/threonine protein kinase
MIDEADIFVTASQIANADLRARFLESACQGDHQLRTRVETLLAQFASWEGAVDRFIEELPQRVCEVGTDSLHSTKPSSFDARTSPPLKVGAKLASYEIRSFLGAGGMGEVYVAFDWRLNRQVALKVLSDRHASDEAWVARFYREAKSASALNHPNVLTVHEVGEFAGNHFIATELVDGTTLRASLQERSWSFSERCSIAIQIADALTVAHQAGVIHRDIKPDNVMIRRDGLVKVLDFGLAKFLESHSTPDSILGVRIPSKTDPSLILGTMRYMSPEQARRKTVDARSDIFCLGILLYELFTSVHPFAGNDDVDSMAAILRKTPTPTRAYVPEIPFELDQLILKMLKKKPEERTETMAEVTITLRGILQRVTAKGGVPLPSTSSLASSPASGSLPKRDSTRVETDNTTSELPEVRYARSGDVNIAYQVLGSGDIDMVFVMGWVSHLEWFWKQPDFARFLRRLSGFARLILFDKRGTGLSDRVEHHQLPTLEQRMEDLHAVMDAVGSERAVLCGVSEGGPMCSLFAATYPHRTMALIMLGSYARRLRCPDYPWGPTLEQHTAFLEEIRRGWGGPVGIDQRAPSMADDPEFRSWWASYLRMGASPGAVLALTRMNAQIDVRPILKSIQVPTLVVHRRGDMCLKFEEGEYLAKQIPGATFVALEGDDHLPFVGEQEEVLLAIESFLSGAKANSRIRHVLATVLMVKVCKQTGVSDSLAALTISHACRDAELFRGRCVSPDSRTVIAAFDGPTRALRAAVAIRDSALRLGATVQLGLHTGQCELADDLIGGVAMEVASAIAFASPPNTILASGTVYDLVAGCELAFVSQDIPAGFEATTRLFQIGD